MLGIRKNSGTRTLISTFSGLVIAVSSVAAFGSVMRVGQGVAQQADFEHKTKQTVTNTTLQLNANSEIAEMKEKSKIAPQNDNYIVKGLNRQNFFQKAAQHKRNIVETFPQDSVVTLISPNRKIVGFWDGEQFCTTDNVCKTIR